MCIYPVLTDNTFYLISFESSAFHRGSNLFPLVYRIAEVKSFKSILKLLSKKSKQLVNTNFRVYLFLQAEKACIFASAYLAEWEIFENFTSTYLCEWQVFENFEFTNFSLKEKRIRKIS